MYRLLIISPYFPPSNTPDMQRIRQLLPFLEENGWESTIVTVDSKYSEAPSDQLLSLTIPKNISIVYVKAFNPKLTRKFGLGSIALRSILFYFFSVNKLLRRNKFDIVFFSTSQFPVFLLGRFWKYLYGVKYVFDFQDPWHSDYYLSKPSNQRPPKFWFSYYLNKYLEKISIKKLDAIVAVTNDYINNLESRYPKYLRNIPRLELPFGALMSDKEISDNISDEHLKINFDKNKYNIVYAGIANESMEESLRIFFEVVSRIEKQNKNLLAIYFFGTSYNFTESDKKTIVRKLVEEYSIESEVFEYPNRISYFLSLKYMTKADLLIIFGSDESSYTSSKLYTYLVSGTPFVGILNVKSNISETIDKFNIADTVKFSSGVADIDNINRLEKIILSKINLKNRNTPDIRIPIELTAKYRSKKLLDFFSTVIKNDPR